MTENRCINCMRKLTGKRGPCPHCGFDPGKYKPPEQTLPPGTTLNNGKYVIGRVLGRGGFGVTYVALDTTLDLRVAIKECLPRNCAWRNKSGNSVQWGLSVPEQEMMLESFVKEARKMARTDEIPGVVRVREYFYDNETAYIVMNYVDGETLARYLRRKGPMNVEECFRVLAPAMDSLAQAHKRGLIHRDISPNNIMIERDGKKVWVLDLGAAKDLGTRLSAPNVSANTQIVGTPGYTPLEQYSPDGKIGPWTDVYAMSSTFFRCMTGQKLQASTSRALKDETPELLRTIRGPVGGVLMKGLAQNPDDRYQSMTELRDALETAIEDIARTQEYHDAPTEILITPPSEPPESIGELWQPEPEPEPQPAPEPELPQPQPEPEPMPEPEPQPAPEPVPEPEPEPIPEPVPAPEPEPIPEPVPAPEPEPMPEPVPTPEAPNLTAWIASQPETPEPIAETPSEMPEAVAETPSPETPPIMTPSLLGPNGKVGASNAQPEAVTPPSKTPKAEREAPRKKRSKKLRNIVIALAVVLLLAFLFKPQIKRGLLQVRPASGECGANASWTLTKDGLMTISGSGNMSTYAEKNRPWKDYAPVISKANISPGITSIGYNAFKSCSNLSSVEIPDSVTKIGYFAFEDCSKLTSVVIPDSVTEIGASAFENSALTSVTLSDSLTEIGQSAFDGCPLTSIVIPDGVTDIKTWAFYGCKQLTSVVIPDSVTTIRKGAFKGCSSLESVSIPADVSFKDYYGNVVYQSDVFDEHTTVKRVRTSAVEESASADGEEDPEKTLALAGKEPEELWDVTG